MDKSYVDTVRLMLEVAPDVFTSGRFAMKGGTALNFFVQELPRLSVDIDVVFVPHQTPRDVALAEIAAELSAIQDRLKNRGIKAEIANSKTGDETKILARRERIEVKVEINHVFRGTLLPVEIRPLTTSPAFPARPPSYNMSTISRSGRLAKPIDFPATGSLSTGGSG